MSGATVTFTDTSTPAVNIVAWTWNFGDGSPLSHVQNPVHVYVADGFYTVMLTVFGAFGGINSTSQLLAIDVYTSLYESRY